MKKFLVPIAWALSILLTLTSCDALGEGIVNALPEELGGVLQEMAPGIFGEKDDPEANIQFIVNTINEGKTVNTVIEEQEEIDVDKAVADLKAEIAALVGEVNFKANADGEKVSGYGAIKDNVIYLAPDGEEEDAYVFIEDDLKLVAVSGSKAEGYYGDVADELAELIEMLQSGKYEEEIEDEIDEDQAQLIEDLMDIKLPEATIEDVIYDEETGRYYLSESYMERVINELAEEILNTYFDVYPEEADDEIYDSIEEGIADTLDVMNLQLWYYVVCEEFTGMGFSAEATDDLGDIAESFEEIDEFNFVFDANNNAMNVELLIKGEEAHELIDVKYSFEHTLDEEGELEKCTVTCNAVVPFNEYEYVEGEYYYNSKSVNIYGLTHMNFSLNMDLANLEGNGNVLSVAFDSEVTDVVAYEKGYSDSRESYSSEYTDKYSRLRNESVCSLSVVASNDGQNYDVDVSVKAKDQFNDSTTRFSLEADIAKTADNMPSIPKAVERARKDAINEYEDEQKNYETEEIYPGW